MDASFNLSFESGIIKNNDSRGFPVNRSLTLSNSSEYYTDQNDNTHVETLAIACVAAVIIFTTVCGNILVVVAVVTERRLRKVGNSFIVSLAVSDLLVGIVVTPFSIVYEVMGQWELGHMLCDIWICLDVTCCTASIMNLCIISFDRYNAITQPLQYACKRTPQRACLMILGAWMYSVIIALPPILGWRETSSLREAKTCLISQDKGYTIFSTVGAFYLPLIVMFYLYGWVFRATLKRKREWIPGPGSSQVSVRMNKVRIDEGSILYAGETADCKTNSTLNKTSKKSKSNKIDTINPYIGYRLMQNGDNNLNSSCESLTTYVISPRKNSRLLQVEAPNSQPRTSIGGISVTCDGSTTYDFSGRNSAYSDGELAENKLTSKRLSIQHEMRSFDIRNSVDKPGRNEGSGNNALRTFRTAAIAINFAQSLPKKKNNILVSFKTFFRRRTVEFETDEASISNDSNPEQEASNLKRKVRKLIRPRKKHISVSQEKRAAKTLGIIMGCFVVCWLPFFVLAVMLPFCPSCDIHPAITSFFTWLGYCNSALNPIIYTFFNQDFRKAFKKILCLRGNAFYKAMCGVCSRKSCSYPV
ncbi:octopamine receptor-like [Tubulanus polymorphus]|uniref:octopamine receptor-like n=1 Tax=Tubulanus polymorphus TaxID=672921 RepID=UPI003DA21B4A